MNERERTEFEHQKRAAEEQLNKLYYGTGGKAQSKGGLTMPSFLASPVGQSGNKKTNNNNNTSKTNSEGKNQNKNPNHEQNDQKSVQKSGSTGGSILNLLNFKGLKMDNDRLVILAVCLLLAGEEADELLMLALMYIML